MHELPETEDGMAQWCRDVFVTKVKTFLHGKSLFFNLAYLWPVIMCLGVLLLS